MTIRHLTVLLFALLSMVGCNKPPAPTPPPPPEVTVAKPRVDEVINYVRFTGQTASVGSVVITPRVTGYIEKIGFYDGDVVEKGTVLFEIDSDEYQVAMAEQQAVWEGAKVRETEARFEYDRTYDAFRVQAATAYELALAKAKHDDAVANVATQKARWDQTNINLGYCHLMAPIRGKISHRMVDVGNLVDEQRGTELATIIQQDPLYVYFSVSENEWLEVLKRHAVARKNADAKTQADRGIIPFDMGLGTGTDYPFTGVMDYVGNQIDSATGTIQCRGIVANPESLMMPGMFTRVRVATGDHAEAILVPETAVGYDQSGSYVFVLDEKNMVSHQNVDVGNRRGDLLEITSGLTADQRVVVKGLLRCRVGRPVTPTEITLPEPAPLPDQASMTEEQVQALLDQIATSVPSDYLTRQPGELPEVVGQPLPKGVSLDENMAPDPDAPDAPQSEPEPEPDTPAPPASGPVEMSPAHTASEVN